MELLEQNVRVRVIQHQSAQQIIPRDEACWLAEIIVGLKQPEGLLNIEVRVLQQKLALAFDGHFRHEQLLP